MSTTVDKIKKSIKAIINAASNLKEKGLVRLYAAASRILPKGMLLFIKNDHKIIEPVAYGRAGIILRIETKMDSVFRTKITTKEPGTVQWIEENIKPGSVFYDIGANVGVFAIIAHKTAPTAKVYAFEPNFGTYKSLVFNLMENKCQKEVSPLMIPLSAKTGRTSFFYQSLEPGTSQHSVDESVDGEGKAFIPVLSTGVISYSIDDLVTKYGFEYPTHIKIDVDGMEYDILQGARNVLEKGSVQSIIVEFCKKNPKSQLIEGYLKSMGYQPKDKHLHVYNPGPKAYTHDNFYDVVFERAA